MANAIAGLSDFATAYAMSPEQMPDATIAQMLLHLVDESDTPRAGALTRLVDRFGGLAEMVSADASSLRKAGVSERAILAFQVTRELSLRLLKTKVRASTVLSSWSDLIDYCTARGAYSPIEEFRVLYLDRKNKLIADEAQQKGTVDHTPVYPREVIKRALELDASAVIMTHNHPSGDPTPSHADIQMTRKVKDACAAVGITLHDHVVVSRGGHVSFRTQGLL